MPSIWSHVHWNEQKSVIPLELTSIGIEVVYTIHGSPVDLTVNHSPYAKLISFYCKFLQYLGLYITVLKLGVVHWVLLGWCFVASVPQEPGSLGGLLPGTKAKLIYKYIHNGSLFDHLHGENFCSSALGLCLLHLINLLIYSADISTHLLDLMHKQWMKICSMYAVQETQTPTSKYEYQTVKLNNNWLSIKTICFPKLNYICSAKQVSSLILEYSIAGGL